MLEQLLTLPGFIYEIDGRYYFLGKWICKQCTDVDASDCVFMYQMCRRSKEEAETNLYFQKIRAYSDFALEIPYNAGKIKQDMKNILAGMSDTALLSLERQVQNFVEDIEKFGL